MLYTDKNHESKDVKIHSVKLVVTCDLVNLVHAKAIELYHDITTNFTVWIITPRPLSKSNKHVVRHYIRSPDGMTAMAPYYTQRHQI